MVTQQSKMSPSAQAIPCNLESIDTPEHVLWRTNRDRLRTIKMQHIWPGCAGLAFVPEQSANVVMLDSQLRSHMFVDTNQLLVATLVSLPAARFQDNDKRDVRLATVSRPKFRHGAVTLDSSSASLQVDFSRCPYDKLLTSSMHIITAGQGGQSDVLNCAAEPQMFGVLNRMQRIVVGHAMKYMATWHKGSQKLKDGPVYCGEDDNSQPRAPRPHDWMPVPYVSTKLSIEQLLNCSRYEDQLNGDLKAEFVCAVKRSLPIKAPVAGIYLGRISPPAHSNWSSKLTDKLHYHCILRPNKQEYVFVTLKSASMHRRPGDEVRKDDEMGFGIADMPVSWLRVNDVQEQYDRLEDQVFGTELLRFHLQSWLQRQYVEVNGEWVVPYHLVSVAATHPKHYDQFQLRYWDFGTPVDCFNTTVDAWLPPVLRMASWDNFHLSLPWNVNINLMPNDLRVRLPWSAEFMRDVLHPGSTEGEFSFDMDASQLRK